MARWHGLLGWLHWRRYALRPGGLLLDQVVPQVRWVRWFLALLAVWAVTALSFYYVARTKYSPSAESHVAGDWLKSTALGAVFALGTFVWLLWRHEREQRQAEPPAQ